MKINIKIFFFFKSNNLNNFYFFKTKNNNIHFTFRKKIISKKYIKKKIKNYLEIGIGEGNLNKKNFKIYKKIKNTLTEFYKKPIKNFLIKKKKYFFKKKFFLKKKNFFKNLKKKNYDIINFNPPYISYKNKNKKTKKLKFEKLNALTDFKNGFFYIKKFFKITKKFLKKKRYFLIEINKKQKKNILIIIKNNKYKKLWIK